MNKKSVIAAVCVLCAVAGAVIVRYRPACDMKLPEKALARVNGYVITGSEFERFAAGMRQAGSGLDKERLLEMMIDDQLLLEEAYRRGLQRHRSFQQRVKDHWRRTLVDDMRAIRAQELQRQHGDRSPTVMERWLRSIRENAGVEINEDVLNAL